MIRLCCWFHCVVLCCLYALLHFCSLERLKSTLELTGNCAGSCRRPATTRARKRRRVTCSRWYALRRSVPVIRLASNAQLEKMQSSNAGFESPRKAGAVRDPNLQSPSKPATMTAPSVFTPEKTARFGSKREQSPPKTPAKPARSSPARSLFALSPNGAPRFAEQQETTINVGQVAIISLSNLTSCVSAVASSNKCRREGTGYAGCQGFRALMLIDRTYRWFQSLRTTKQRVRKATAATRKTNPKKASLSSSSSRRTRSRSLSLCYQLTFPLPDGNTRLAPLHST